VRWKVDARGEVEGGRPRVGGRVALAGEQLSTIHVHRRRNNYMQCKRQWSDYTEKASPFSAIRRAPIFCIHSINGKNSTCMYV
jgi:hypothetical protein